jgi:hypothetical protein
MIDRGHDLPITKPCQNTRQEIAQRLFVLLQISNHSVRTARGELFEEFSEAWEHSRVMRSHSRAKLDYCKPLICVFRGRAAGSARSRMTPTPTQADRFGCIAVPPVRQIFCGNLTVID